MKLVHITFNCGQVEVWIKNGAGRYYVSGELKKEGDPIKWDGVYLWFSDDKTSESTVYKPLADQVIEELKGRFGFEEDGHNYLNVVASLPKYGPEPEDREDSTRWQEHDSSRGEL